MSLETSNALFTCGGIFFPNDCNTMEMFQATCCGVVPIGIGIKNVSHVVTCDGYVFGFVRGDLIRLDVNTGAMRRYCVFEQVPDTCELQVFDNDRVFVTCPTAFNGSVMVTWGSDKDRSEWMPYKIMGTFVADGTTYAYGILEEGAANLMFYSDDLDTWTQYPQPAPMTRNGRRTRHQPIDIIPDLVSNTPRRHCTFPCWDPTNRIWFVTHSNNNPPEKVFYNHSGHILQGSDNEPLAIQQKGRPIFARFITPVKMLFVFEKAFYDCDTTQPNEHWSKKFPWKKKGKIVHASVAKNTLSVVSEKEGDTFVHCILLPTQNTHANDWYKTYRTTKLTGDFICMHDHKVVTSLYKNEQRVLQTHKIFVDEWSPSMHNMYPGSFKNIVKEILLSRYRKESSHRANKWKSLNNDTWMEVIRHIANRRYALSSS